MVPKFSGDQLEPSARIQCWFFAPEFGSLAVEIGKGQSYQRKPVPKSKPARAKVQRVRQFCRHAGQVRFLVGSHKVSYAKFLGTFERAARPRGLAAVLASSRSPARAFEIDLVSRGTARVISPIYLSVLIAFQSWPPPLVTVLAQRY